MWPLRKFVPPAILLKMKKNNYLIFCSQEKLLKAMQSCNEKLTEEEKRRNKHGPMFVFTYTDEDLGT